MGANYTLVPDGRNKNIPIIITRSVQPSLKKAFADGRKGGVRYKFWKHFKLKEAKNITKSLNLVFKENGLNHASANYIYVERIESYRITVFISK